MKQSENQVLLRKQMLSEMASQMSESARAEIRSLIDELGLSLVNVSCSTLNRAAL